jgi:photosystem II stability/assembly factor-like uncharacterized protein
VLAALVAGLRVGGRTPGKSQSSLSPGVSSLWFADRMAGFAATSSGVFSTSDGGHTWRRVLRGVAVDSLTFVDREHGWARAGPRLLRTVDGGESWQQLMLEPSDPLLAVDFVTPQDGWAATSSGEVAATHDGGEQWARQPSVGRVESVCFLDRNRGWAAGAGAVQSTVDGGRHWQLAYQLPSVAEPDQQATAHCKSDKVWVLFQGNGAASKQDYNLVASEVGTSQWTVLAHGSGFVLEPTLPGAADVHGLGDYSGPFTVVDADTALLIGECQACFPTQVFLTVAHLHGPWSGQTIPALDGTAYNLSAMFFVDATHGWVAGTRSEDDAIVIAATADGGIGWTSIPGPPG